jgi:hypothetical protein
VTDDVVANPLGADFRFYRVKRADDTETSWQTAGVFELDLVITFSVGEFFISTPLLPDPDHASVQAVLSTQIPRSGPIVTRLVHASGIKERMRYSAGTWTELAPTPGPFDIEAGRGYLLSTGGGLPQTLTVRLTGYVPDVDQSVFVGKAGFGVSDHWIAYAMPRPTTLDDLGLVDAVTPWSSSNLVQLKPLGSAVWTTYQYDDVGEYWFDVLNVGVPVNPTLTCGSAVAFSRKGIIDASDMLPMPKWYAHPPNDW